ncbi:hypothetical protein GCM10027048_38690 [Hymenobacter coalescens]
MKALILLTSLVLSTTASALAAPAPVAAAALEQRVDRLSDYMARSLRLNNYQTTRLRAINEDKLARLAALEATPDADPAAARAILKQRDLELRRVLSTDQYSAYYSSRAAFQRFDEAAATSLSAL